MSLHTFQKRFVFSFHLRVFRIFTIYNQPLNSSYLLKTKTQLRFTPPKVLTTGTRTGRGCKFGISFLFFNDLPYFQYEPFLRLTSSIHHFNALHQIAWSAMGKLPCPALAKRKTLLINEKAWCNSSGRTSSPQGDISAPKGFAGAVFFPKQNNLTGPDPSVFFGTCFCFFFGGEGFLFLKELGTVYHISSNNNVKVCII